MDIKSQLESWHPKLKGKDYNFYKVTGDFNCIAFTLDIFDGWMWTNTTLWPHETIPRNSGVDGFKRLYEIYGYVPCIDGSYEPGFEKIAFFTKDGYPTHASKQFGKIWKSKLGPSVILEHQLDWISGYSEDDYGDVEFFMKRKIQY